MTSRMASGGAAGWAAAGAGAGAAWPAGAAGSCSRHAPATATTSSTNVIRTMAAGYDGGLRDQSNSPETVVEESLGFRFLSAETSATIEA